MRHASIAKTEDVKKYGATTEPQSAFHLRLVIFDLICFIPYRIFQVVHIENITVNVWNLDRQY